MHGNLVYIPVELLHNLYQVTVFGCAFYYFCAFWKTMLSPQQLVEACRSEANHLKERLLDQAQARASYTPFLGGHAPSIPQGMIFDVQSLVKSLFCPIRRSPNGFFDSEASIP